MVPRDFVSIRQTMASQHAATPKHPDSILGGVKWLSSLQLPFVRILLEQVRRYSALEFNVVILNLSG